MVFKCKMCGGDIHPDENTKLITCEYCGSTQTICHIDNTSIASLFNRANEQRLNNEFDKAEALYDSIIEDAPHEAEAYWGKCLCKYGIEYVDDKSGKKIPTCHRTRYESIFDDNDYRNAEVYADPVSRNQYKAEAEEIDRLQKDILKVVKREDPFDVFICYKETDDNGDRTKDSVYAQDLYDALTAKGYKVFFSRITLEDKLGVEFEPYIFAALQSAKIMLVVGTKYENFDAVWVKNEWKRYIGLSKKDKSKHIIPCYADIQPSEMPREFAMLQGQDLKKIGAVQDIVRGVEKLLESNNNTGTSDKKRKKLVLITAASVLILAILIIAGIMLFGKRKDKNSKTEFDPIEVTDYVPDSDKYDYFHVNITEDNWDVFLNLVVWADSTGWEWATIKGGIEEEGWYLFSPRWVFDTDIYSKCIIEVNNGETNYLENNGGISFKLIENSKIQSVKGEVYFVSKNMIDRIEEDEYTHNIVYYLKNGKSYNEPKDNNVKEYKDWPY